MDEYECTECCWTGFSEELEHGRCPDCGSRATLIDDYDIIESLGEGDIDEEDLELLFEDEGAW